MRRISVGLLKNPVKTLNANTGNVVVDGTAIFAADVAAEKANVALPMALAA